MMARFPVKNPEDIDELWLDVFSVLSKVKNGLVESKYHLRR